MLARNTIAAAIVAATAVIGANAVFGDGAGDPAAVKNEAGKYYDKDGDPTFKVAADGTVDWYTYSGYRRYHSECHVCHGPDGEGSTYAPGLRQSLQRISYADFLNVVINGRKNVNSAQESVMPSLGTNPNVACYLDDIYVYLRARANDTIPRGRPEKREDKPKAAADAENSCLGQKS